MKLVLPNYQNSILNVTSSILNYYNSETSYSTIENLNQFLNKKYQHIALILLDGLGINCLNQHLDENAGLRKHISQEITSVFPPTTVAATNAVLSGQPPISSGYVGWVQYFKKENSNTIVFFNKDFYDSQKTLTYNLMEELAYESIYSKIKKASPDVETYELFPAFRSDGFATFHDQVSKILEITNSKNRTFTYVYWDQPDSTEHQFGVKSKEVKEVVLELNSDFERLINLINDETLVIVIADHGLTDIEELDVFFHEDLVNCFSKNPSMEPRACSFFIKEEKMDEFKNLFQKYYNDNFLLLTKEEFYSLNLLGSGIKHPLLDDFIGDYIAIATNKYNLSMNKEKQFKAHHAGLTKEEMMVPLIVFGNKIR